MDTFREAAVALKEFAHIVDQYGFRGAIVYVVLHVVAFCIAIIPALVAIALARRLFTLRRPQNLDAASKECFARFRNSGYLIGVFSTLALTVIYIVISSPSTLLEFIMVIATGAFVAAATDQLWLRLLAVRFRWFVLITDMLHPQGIRSKTGADSDTRSLRPAEILSVIGIVAIILGAVVSCSISDVVAPTFGLIDSEAGGVAREGGDAARVAGGVHIPEPVFGPRPPLKPATMGNGKPALPPEPVRPPPPPAPIESPKSVVKVPYAPSERDLDRVRKAANSGDPSAMANLGCLCLDGIGGVAKDEVAAVKWFEAAAQAGNGLAMNNLGAMYEKGQGGLALSETDALRWYRKGSEAGNGLAMANLGTMYARGSGGIAKDELQSVFWYQKATEAGSSSGMYNLGVCYLNGAGGLAKDEKKAVELFLKATDANSDGGRGMAANNLGIMYEAGRGGLNKDAVEAAKWYRRGAELGCGLATVNLGTMYSQGCGVPHDDAEAVKWFRKGIEAGEPRGFGSLGWMYANGFGVQRDDAEAVKWYRKGVDAGDGMSMRCLAGMYADGRGVPQDDRQAVLWFQKAADAGDGGGMAGLATAYENGVGGLPKDHGLARQWMLRAAAAGVDEANQWLKENP